MPPAFLLMCSSRPRIPPRTSHCPWSPRLLTLFQSVTSGSVFQRAPFSAHRKDWRERQGWVSKQPGPKFPPGHCLWGAGRASSLGPGHSWELGACPRFSPSFREALPRCLLCPPCRNRSSTRPSFILNIGVSNTF